MDSIAVLIGLLIGVLCAILIMFFMYPLQHASNRRKNVLSARAGNVQNAAQCYGKSCANVNNNAAYY